MYTIYIMDVSVVHGGVESWVCGFAFASEYFWIYAQGRCYQVASVDIGSIQPYSWVVVSEILMFNLYLGRSFFNRRRYTHSHTYFTIWNPTQLTHTTFHLFSFFTPPGASHADAWRQSFGWRRLPAHAIPSTYIYQSVRDFCRRGQSTKTTTPIMEPGDSGVTAG